MYRIIIPILLFFTSSCFGLTTASFRPDEVSGLLPLTDTSVIYYIKAGSLWRAGHNIYPEKIYNLDSDICAFDVSSDQELLVCSTKKYPEQSSSPINPQKTGDTLFFYNLLDGKGSELYSNKTAKIRDITFAPRSGLFVVALNDEKNNIVMIINPKTKAYKTYTKERKSDMFSSLSIQDISPDGKHALLKFEFFEGSLQRILNLETASLEGYQTSSTVIQGNYLLGFIGPEQLLGYTGKMSGQNKVKINLSVRDFTTLAEQSIGEFDRIPSYFDGHSDPKTVVFRLSPYVGNEKSSFYGIDKNTNKFKVLSENKFILAYVEQYQSIWITDTNFGYSRFIDTSVRSAHDIKVK